MACGDFNTTDVDKLSKTRTFIHARTRLRRESEDTFMNYKRPFESHGEIDHFFCDYGIGLLRYEVGSDNMSDHKPIKLEYYKI